MYIAWEARMLVYTQNSVYQVTARDNHFEVTKVAESRSSAAATIGETFRAESIYVRVGGRAKLGDFETSKVTKIVS